MKYMYGRENLQLTFVILLFRSGLVQEASDTLSLSLCSQSGLHSIANMPASLCFVIPSVGDRGSDSCQGQGLLANARILKQDKFNNSSKTLCRNIWLCNGEHRSLLVSCPSCLTLVNGLSAIVVHKLSVKVLIHSWFSSQIKCHIPSNIWGAHTALNWSLQSFDLNIEYIILVVGQCSLCIEFSFWQCLNLEEVYIRMM